MTFKKNLRMSNNFEDASELCIPGGARGKGLPASARDLRDIGLIPGLGRSPDGGHSSPLHSPTGESHGQKNMAVYSP